MRLYPMLTIAAVLLAAGCDERDSNIPEGGPPPVTGGTLHVTSDGTWAIASDPARAAIHVVNLDRREQTARIDLGPQDWPGRVAEDNAGGVHVVLRQSGQVVTIDPASGTITRRVDVCAAPRGIDADPDTGELIVACAEGHLVRLTPAYELVRRVTLVHDLRDVVAQSGGRTYVSRFRSAEVLVLDGDTIVDRVRPEAASGTIGPSGSTRVATVAWRLRERPGGGVLLVHQESVSSQLGDPSFPGAPYYGGDCSFGVVRPAVTEIDPGLTTRTLALTNTSLAVDAVDQGGSGVVVAAASEPGVPRDSWGFTQMNGTRRVTAGSSSSGCVPTSDAFSPSGSDARPQAATAVAVAPDGTLVAQYRDPAQLVVGGDTIDLDGGSVEDFGHALFHEAAGTGVTCASCHPEGAEDGHVWIFDVGARRTQTLNGGILATAPFHWRGDVPNTDQVLDGTFVGRMSGTMPRPDEVDSFAQWMDQLPATPGPVVDADAVARGREVFEEADCASCHAGELRTNNQTLDVGTGGRFQVPALYEVIYHAPYFHDGSARGLDELVSVHEGGAALDDGQRGALVTYLRSL